MFEVNHVEEDLLDENRFLRRRLKEVLDENKQLAERVRVLTELLNAKEQDDDELYDDASAACICGRVM